MRALVKEFKKEGLWLKNVPKPELQANDVLVKIKKAAICGTDLHIYLWDEWSQKTIPTPMTIGHEFVGEIVELGSAVNNLKIGTRVSAEGHIVCGTCRNCLAGDKHLCINTKGIGVNIPGAFAEYLAVPAVNIFEIPDNVPDDIAAIMDPFGNATHTALSFNLVGEDVLITGAGPIGIMAALIAQHVGAKNVVITDINEYRLNLAKDLGVKTVVDVSKVRDLRSIFKSLGMNEGFDVGMEMSGSPLAFTSMLDTVRSGAKLALLGILPNNTGIDWDKVIFKGLHLKGIYGREIFETWYKMKSMVQSGLDINKIITHHFKLEDFEKGFKLMKEGKSGKVILEF